MNRLELLSKRKNIVIVRCHAKTTLYIRSITKIRDNTFLRRYFSNENLSGGGDIISDPVLLNDGKEAIVNFKQPEGNLITFLSIIINFCLHISVTKDLVT